MEKFIKDDAELNDFLLSRVSEDASIVARNGKTFSGKALISLMRRIEKLEMRVTDAEGAGTPRDLFLALTTYPVRAEASMLEDQDSEFTAGPNRARLSADLGARAQRGGRRGTPVRGF